MTREDMSLLVALNRSILKWALGILGSIAVAAFALGVKIANAQRDVTDLQRVVEAVAPLGDQVDSLRFELRALTKEFKNFAEPKDTEPRRGSR